MRIFLFLLIISLGFAEKIQIGSEILEVEVAKTLQQRTQGLMGRTELKDGEGMLFVYSRSHRLSFWMKDTLIPLSIGFFNDRKELLHVLDMDPPISNTLIKYRSRSPALYALEVPQGWFEKHRIKRGEKFSFVDSSTSIK
jgi:hypothetical protein